MILGLGEKPMGRREFIALFGSGLAGWPLAARAQQAAAEALGVEFSDNLLSFAKLSNESGGLLYEIVTRGVNP